MRLVTRLVAAAAGLLLATPALAASPEAEAAWERLTASTSLQASFEQVQTRKILAVPIASEGRITFVRPDKLRWETTGAAAQIAVLADDALTLHVPSLGPPQHLQISDQPEIAGMVRGLTVWLAADLDAVEKDYALTWHGGTPAKATLVPRDPAIQGLIAKLDLTLSEDGRYIQAVTITEPDGDHTDLRLTDVTLDAAVPDTTFELGTP